MRIRGDQLHPARPRAVRCAGVGLPAGSVLGAGEPQAEDLAGPVAVDPGRDERVHVDHPAAFAYLRDQDAGGEEGVGVGVQRPVPELCYQLVEVLGPVVHLGLRLPRMWARSAERVP